jgi:hypothetical protein
MVNQEHIMQLVNARMKKILHFAELAMPESKFDTFRKLTLDEFGKSGLVKELERVLRSSER